MKVHIDPGRCQGHGLCAALHPDVFDLDARGFSVVQGAALDDQGSLDPRLLAEVNEAIDTCPEDAIALIGAPTGLATEGDGA